MKTLEAVDVSKRFRDLTAVDAVSLRVEPGETVALVGESGSGKSTLGRLLVGLLRPDSGSISYGGVSLATMSRGDLAAFRRDVQIVFQDPSASLNPRLTVGSMLEEVLKVHRLASGNAIASRVVELLERVGLDPAAARRYPHEFSGGQRQRVGIARALAVEPRIIVADEPVSALDVSVQAKVLGLLKDLQKDLGIGYLLISHDLAVVRWMADRLAVLRAGRVVEKGSANEVYAHPTEEYTRALISAVPTLPIVT